MATIGDRKQHKKTGDIYTYTADGWERESGVMDYVRPVLAGALYNFGDEAEAGIRTGGGLWGDYGEIKKDIGNKMSQFATANPALNFALEAGGGLATGPVGLGRAMAARGVQSIPRMVGIGAAEGALSGAGAAETMGDIAPSAGFNAVLGGGLGGLLGGAGRGIQRLAGQGRETGAQQFAADIMTKGGVTPEQMIARQANMGQAASPVHTMGEPGTMLAQALVQAAPETARATAARTSSDLLRGTSQRIRNAVSQATGREPDFWNAIRSNSAARTAAASPVYQRVMEIDLPYDESLTDLLERPMVKNAYRKARKLAANEGQKMRLLRRGGKWIEQPTIREWNYIKQGLDDIQGKNTNDITGRMLNEGRQAAMLKRDIVGRLNEYTDNAYQQALDAWAGPSAIEDSMKLGRNFLRRPTEDIVDMVGNASRSEKDAFLMGATSAIAEKVGSKPTGQIGAYSFLETENVGAKLRAALPDGEEGERVFRTLMDSVSNERQFAETANAVYRGSQTALREAIGDRLRKSGPSITEMVTEPKQALASGVKSQLDKMLSDLPEGSVEALSELLFQPGGTQAFLDFLNQANSRIGSVEDIVRAGQLGLSKAGTATMPEMYK